MHQAIQAMETDPLDYAKYDKLLNEKVFIVHEMCRNKKIYKKSLKFLYRFMKQGFEIPEVRKHPLKFRFDKYESESVKTMEIRHFIVNLMIWGAFVRYDKVNEINSSQIFDCHNITSENLTNFLNDHLITPYSAEINARTISKALDDVIYRLSNIYLDFALIMGLSMDMEMFIELRNKYPRFRELLNTKPREGMQPQEIEEMLSNRLDEYIDIVVNQDKTNNIRPFLVTGEGINHGQLAQFSIMDGLKPDIEGNVLPIPIDSNFINGGLDTVTNFYIDGQAGSKPLIMNKTVMGKSGYFSYKTMTLSSSYRLSQTVHDCHSKRPIKFEVKSNKHLAKIDKRYYYDDLGNLQVVNAKKDKWLIGKTILLRDPTTCCAKDGICHVCYGDLYYTNRDPQFHAGRYAATQVNNPIQQKILSSKHMLRTVSNKIAFNKEFSNFFILDTNKIILNPNIENSLKEWKVFIPDENIFYEDELAGADNFNMYVEKLYLVNTSTSKRKQAVIEIQEKGEHDLYLFDYVANLLSNDTLDTVEGKSFPLSKLEINEPIAILNIVNNELSTPLKNIIKLLDRKDHFGCTTIDDLVNKFVQLTIDSKMSVAAVHGSMLIKGLIRCNDNILAVPDFTKEINDDDYQILTVSKALIYNPSLSVSFAFDNANKQISSPVTYRKYKPSDYDIFFKDDIYEDSIKFYKNKKKKKEMQRLQRKLYLFRKHMNEKKMLKVKII